MASSVVMERKDLITRLTGAFTVCSILVDVVSKMDNVVMLILSGSVAVCVEVTIG